MSPRQKRYLYNIGGSLLSVLFIYFCFHALRGQNLSNIFAIPHPWFFIPAVVLNLPLMSLHTYSWKISLAPIKKFLTLFDISTCYMGIIFLKAGNFFALFISKK
jgi:hypothetical protein